MPRLLSSGREVASGLFFPEALRWHNGALWFSDVFGKTVNYVDGSNVQCVTTTEGMPSGLGWLPDGTLLYVSMNERVIMASDAAGRTRVYADLSSLLSHPANDMIVDPLGRAYVGNYGFDVDSGAAQATTRLVRVDPDGEMHVEAPEFLFPNGMALVNDGDTLLVAETFGDRVTAVSVGVDGSLHDPRPVFDLAPGDGPDGIAVDGVGRVWIPCAFGSRVMGGLPDGTVTAEVGGDGVGVNCCAVGGEGGSTLFLATAPMDEEVAAEEPCGRILAFEI